MTAPATELHALDGPACEVCGTSEARCAWRQGCCDACSHRFDGSQRVPRRPDCGTGHVYDLKPCGTYAAARRHERRGEALCPPCRQARSRRQADLKASRRDRA